MWSFSSAWPKRGHWHSRCLRLCSQGEWWKNVCPCNVQMPSAGCVSQSRPSTDAYQAEAACKAKTFVLRHHVDLSHALGLNLCIEYNRLQTVELHFLHFSFDQWWFRLSNLKNTHIFNKAIFLSNSKVFVVHLMMKSRGTTYRFFFFS